MITKVIKNTSSINRNTYFRFIESASRMQ